MDLMYVVGEPGVGKTTLVKHLTRGLPYEDTTVPFAYRRYDCGIWELGARRPDFGGTDALALNVQPVVEQTLEGHKPRFVLAEGDRLANAKFLTTAQRLGYTVHVVHVAGMDVAEMQRRQRGSKQDATWVKGRRTKVYALAAQFRAAELPAGVPLNELENLIINPVMDHIRAAREALAVREALA